MQIHEDRGLELLESMTGKPFVSSTFRLYFSRAKAALAKTSENGYGTRMGFDCSLVYFMVDCFSFRFFFTFQRVWPLVVDMPEASVLGLYRYVALPRMCFFFLASLS